MSKISLGNSPEEVPLSLWLFSFHHCLQPHPLIQGFTPLKIHEPTSAVSRYIHTFPCSLFGTQEERFTANLVS